MSTLDKRSSLSNTHYKYNTVFLLKNLKKYIICEAIRYKSFDQLLIFFLQVEALDN